MRALNWLKTLLKSPEQPEGYRVFTKDYDEIIFASDLAEPTGEAAIKWQSECASYANKIPHWREQILPALPKQDLHNCVISLLVDHSGSMRGANAMTARAACETLFAHFTSAGAKVEILGFTTRSWKGGKSRQLWLCSGQLPNVGRLCDLRHIIYAEADDPDGAAPSLAQFQNEVFLKENIDGEALEWAASRLKGRREARKIVIVLSDGAPVDDSTLQVNTEQILWRHLLNVVKDLRNEGEIEVLGLGICHDVADAYPNAVKANSPDDLAACLPKLAALLSENFTKL